MGRFQSTFRSSLGKLSTPGHWPEHYQTRSRSDLPEEPNNWLLRCKDTSIYEKGENTLKMRAITPCFTSLTTIVSTKLNSFATTVDQNSEGNIVERLEFFLLSITPPLCTSQTKFPVNALVALSSFQACCPEWMGHSPGFQPRPHLLYPLYAAWCPAPPSLPQSILDIGGRWRIFTVVVSIITNFKAIFKLPWSPLS